ncbi:MAG: MarR family winged helix-turn-helix transcriptional regulator [Eubacteriales bacterium]|nr:MarR family winged helix-turn-helix transcriptional regulator [Eubacteriales bacterium]
MDSYQTMNDIWVHLFHDILDAEEKALTTSEFKDISVNDMHILEAIGIGKPKNMSSVSKILDVTVGTLTIAINNLVKKGYVHRVRSEEDRRVVLIFLAEKGKKAFLHHQSFHESMVQAIVQDLPEEEIQVLSRALIKVDAFFRKYL